MFKVLNKLIKINNLRCFNNQIKLFCKIEKPNEYVIQNINKSEISHFEKKSKEIQDLLKVINTKFDTLDVDNLIKTLLLCAKYSHPPELLKKLEKRLIKHVTSMKEDQVVNTMLGFNSLNLKSNSILFAFDRILGKDLMSYNKNSFVNIFKCISKYGKNQYITFSQNIQLILRNYIEKNISKFSLSDLCDIFLYYPYILKTIPESKDTEIYSNLLSHILPFIENLDVSRLSRLYFLLYSNKSDKIVSKLFEDLRYEYTDSFFNKFSSSEIKITKEVIYQIILTHHFSNEIFKSKNAEEKFKDFIIQHTLQLLSQFTPEEINSIMTIFIQNKNTFRLTDENLSSILDEFVKLTHCDSENMNVDELILYMQTILICLQNNYDADHVENCLFELEEKAMKKISYYDTFQTSSLLELMHHFKNHISLDKYFKKINLDSLTTNLIKVLTLKTQDDVLKIFDDYYLIYLFLFDLKYDNKMFWKEFTNFSKLFFVDYEDDKFSLFFRSRKVNLDKLRILIDIKTNELKI
jgi:hypothetical protein